jgi:hypothetical protein
MNHIHDSVHVVTEISPNIRHFAEALLSKASFGICGGKARLTDTRSG